MAQPDKPRYRLGTRRLVAVSLLLVLLTGLNITTFTVGWMAFLPYHDHLIAGVRALGIVHHSHDSDARDHARHALQTHAPEPGQDQQEGIVSLKPMSAQPELNSFTAQGLVGGDSLPVSPGSGASALLAALLLATGLRYAPPAPPPRAA